MSGLVLQTADLDLENDCLRNGGLLVEFGRKFRINRNGSTASTKSAEQAEQALTPAKSFATLRKNAVEFA